MKTISKGLLDWYAINKRPLPWRQNKNPYSVWLSEIILQQTKVDQGLPYYLKFIDNYPNVVNLAQASEDEVLKLWQGLGYYSRARNLHKASKIVQKELDGVFPSDYKSLLQLPGIGEYTAAAIASISYNERVPVLDGNVYRILSRIFNISELIGSSATKKAFLAKGLKFMGNHDPGEFNQAMMEFGALQCKPKSPNCEVCVLKKKCLAYKNDLVAILPNVKKKKPLTNRFLNYFVLTDDKETIMQKRVDSDIWKGLYEFPLVESQALLESHELPFSHEILESMDFKHLLTHRRLFIRFYVLKCEKLPNLSKGQEKLALGDLGLIAVPKPIESFLEKSQELHLKIF